MKGRKDKPSGQSLVSSNKFHTCYYCADRVVLGFSDRPDFFLGTTLTFRSTLTVLNFLRVELGDTKAGSFPSVNTEQPEENEYGQRGGAS